MTAILIHIAGSPVAFLSGAFGIDDVIDERSTVSFTVIDVTGTAQYRKGQPVYIWDDEDFYVFGGVIETSVEKKVSPDGTKFHSITCADWHYLADKRIAAKAYTNTLAGDVVKDLVTSYLAAEGVTVAEDVGFYFVMPGFAADYESTDSSTVENGPLITEAIFNYVPVSQTLDALAEKAGFWWYIDARKVLHFKSRAINTAPWIATGADMLEGTVEVEHGNPKYRNRQYIKGGRDVTDPQTEIKAGDGQARAFTMGFPLALEPTVEISLNGAAYSAIAASDIGIKGVETGKKWYWAKGDPIIYQADTETVLAAVDKVRTTYQGEFDIVAISQNPGAVDDKKSIEGGGTGYVEDVADEPNTTTRAAAFESANKKLEKYAVIGKRLKFRTRRYGLRPGQLLTVNLPEHDLNSDEMLIESVSISEDSNVIWYDISCVEGPEQGTWAKLFYAMATRGQAFVVRENIGEDEILITLAEFTKTWLEAETPNIFYTLRPGAGVFPGVGVRPMFATADRVKYLAWLDGANVEQGRKAITQQTGAATNTVLSVTYLAPWDANITIAKLAWYGGVNASATVGSGIQVGIQAYAHIKTELEAIQVNKTDTKGW